MSADFDPLNDPAFVTGLDKALATGEMQVVAWGGAEVVLVPDIAEAEAMANGLPDLPATYELARDDGRRLRVYQMPKNWRDR